MQVKDMMKEPYIIDKDISLLEAAKIMSDNRLNSLLFVLNGRAKGIITEEDLLKNFGQHKRISNIMSKNIITIAPEENVEDALKLMKDNKIKQVPVVDDKKNLLGVISMIDIASNMKKFDGDFFFN